MICLPISAPVLLPAAPLPHAATAALRFGGRQVARQQEAADREELLARAELGRQIKSEMDEEAAVAGHVTRSRRYLNEMFDQGTNILANMAGNRERIKVREVVEEGWVGGWVATR